MIDFLRDIFAFVKEYWGTIGFIATWTGIALVYFRKRFYWHRKHFLEQVNFSLNYLQDGQLVMRTLMELPSQEVWLNEFGVQRINNAAKKTTPTNPFITLEDPRDQQFINRAVLNSLSEHFSEVYLARALGIPVQTGKFYFTITCEKYEEMRTYKLRVLIADEKTLLEDFAQGGAGDSEVIPDIVYQYRQQSLRAMHQLYHSEKQAGGHGVGELEMGVVL